MTEEKRKQGKANRASGKRFELKVAADLESRGWIVAKWPKNVEFIEGVITKISGNKDIIKGTDIIKNTNYKDGKLVNTKPKFNPFTKSLMMNSGGFPDFIAFKPIGLEESKKGVFFEISDILVEKLNGRFPYEIIGVECKMGKYLDKIEKEKCDWLLKNNIFSKILIAMPDELHRGKILYKEFENAI